MNWFKNNPNYLKENKNFMSWFGSSKVVNSDGSPKVVYKGMSPHDYTKENRETGDKGPYLEHIQRQEPFPSFDSKDSEPVHLAGFFTDKPDVAQTFAMSTGAIFPVFLSIQNPKIFDADGKPSGKIQFGAEGKPFRDAIRSGKFDGVFILNTIDEGNVYIPLKSSQIKSALANKNFDAKDKRINAGLKI